MNKYIFVYGTFARKMAKQPKNHSRMLKNIVLKYQVLKHFLLRKSILKNYKLNIYFISRYKLELR